MIVVNFEELQELLAKLRELADRASSDPDVVWSRRKLDAFDREGLTDDEAVRIRVAHDGMFPMNSNEPNEDGAPPAPAPRTTRVRVANEWIP